MHHACCYNWRLHLDNLNLLLRESAIRFEFLAQKKDTGKQTAGILCYKYQVSFTGAYARCGKT